MELVKVFLLLDPMILMSKQKEVVSHGELEDGSRVILPTKLMANFLPDKDKDGTEFVMLSKDHLFTTKSTIQPKHFN